MKWITVGFDECINCGNSAQIQTDSKEAGFFFDGDSVRCVECRMTGNFSCDTENEGWISWDDTEEGT